MGFVLLSCRLGDNLDAGNPYLTPLLDPSMHPGGTMEASQNCYDAETQGSSPSSALPSKETAETTCGTALSDMSIADAIKCITGFLKTDSRSAVLFASSTLTIEVVSHPVQRRHAGGQSPLLSRHQWYASTVCVTALILCGHAQRCSVSVVSESKF